MNYYIGLSLAASSGMDTGVAVMDEDNNLILVDKLYTINDIIYFFDNFPSLKYSKYVHLLFGTEQCLTVNGVYSANLIKWSQQIR